MDGDAPVKRLVPGENYVTKTKKAAVKATKATKATKSRQPTKPEKTSKDEITVNRRDSSDRRATSGDRRVKDDPVGEDRRTDEQRRKTPRRRQIDPTTCERDYSETEIEFMQAMDDYKRANGRMFPTCSEILEVLLTLGYEKVDPATKSTPDEVAVLTNDSPAENLAADLDDTELDFEQPDAEFEQPPADEEI